MPLDEAPPFDLFTPQEGSDRRRYHRIRCYVAVEIHVEGIDEPVWGNLANASRGGCLVETSSPVPAGKALEIGLWLANGNIWVKGITLSGIVDAQFAVVWNSGEILRGGTLGKRTPAGIS